MRKTLGIFGAAAFALLIAQPASAQYNQQIVSSQNAAISAPVISATASVVASTLSSGVVSSLGAIVNIPTAPPPISIAPVAPTGPLLQGTPPPAGGLGGGGVAPPAQPGTLNQGSQAPGAAPNGQAGLVARALWSVGDTGLAAAAASRGINVWAQGGYTRSENTFNQGSNNDLRFKGDIWVGMVGADYRLTQRAILGVAAGYQHVDINTIMNAGKLKQSGFGVNPYFVFAFSQQFFVDLSAGYWWLDNETNRSSGAVKADYNSTRWNVGGNLNYVTFANRWSFLTSVGYGYTSAKSDSYIERGTGAVAGTIPGATSNIGQGKLSGTATYAMGNISPFFRLGIEHNFSQPKTVLNNGIGGQPKENRTGYRTGIGVNFNLSPTVSGNIGGSYLFGKSDYKEYGATGQIRVSF